MDKKDEVVPVNFSRKVLSIFKKAKKKNDNSQKWRSQPISKK